MITRAPVLLSTILILGLGFSYEASAQSAAPESTPAEVGTAAVVNFRGKIVDVDTAKSLVTLEGRKGDE